MKSPRRSPWVRHFFSALSAGTFLVGSAFGQSPDTPEQVHLAPIPPIQSQSELFGNLPPTSAEKANVEIGSAKARVVFEKPQVTGPRMMYPVQPQRTAQSTNQVAHRMPTKLPARDAQTVKTRTENPIPFSVNPGTNPNQLVAYQTEQPERAPQFPSPGASVLNPMDTNPIVQLGSLSYEEFEQKLMATWGGRITGEALDQNRTLRIVIPATRTTPAFSMLFDRLTRVLKLECQPQKIGGWKKTIALLDRKPTIDDPNVVHLVDLVSTPMEEIQKVVYLVSQNQDEPAAQLPAVPPAQDQGGDDEGATAEIQLPQDRPLQLPNIVQGIAQEQLEALSRVTIEVIEDSKVMVIKGKSDEDVATVRALIEKIVKTIDVTSGEIASIKLKFRQADTVSDAIQETYDNSFADSLGPATISAIPPNTLLVAGKSEAIKKIQEMVDSIDRESDDVTEEVEFKTFRLRFISANDAKQRIDAYFGQSLTPISESLPPTGNVFTIADYRSNSLVVRASKQGLFVVEKLLEDLDVQDSEATDVVKVFDVKNMAAEDLALILQDAVSGQSQTGNQAFTLGQNNQNQQQNQNQNQLQNNQGNTSQLRAPALQLITVDRNGNEVTIGGGAIMHDVRVSTNVASNQVIVSGPAKSMDLISALVARLDVPPTAETQIKVFTIVNGDSEALLTMLQTLFLGNQGQGGQGQAQGQGASSLTEFPLQSPATDGNSLVNLRFSSDQRTNSIIVSGPVGDLRVVEDLLTRLDEGDIQNRRVSVYRLSNAPVLDVVDAINNWLDQRNDLITNDIFGDGGSLQRTRRQVIVSPEVVSNSLIVSAIPEYYDQIEQIIRALDRRPPMVKVEVMIAEVTLSNTDEFGIEGGIQSSLLFDAGLSNTIGTNFINLDSVAGQGLSSLNVGRLNNDLGYGGLVLSAGSESVNLLLRALKDRQCVRVLSKPHMMTLENLRGRVQVGQQVPFVTGVNQNQAGGISNTVEFIDVGVILELTPRVSPDGMIVMFVDATNSSLGTEEEGTTIFVNNNGDVVRQRPINTTNAQTSIMARSGQTVVFSGLLREEKSNTRNGMPILSDLPVIGPIFGFRSDTARRSELLIVMTPYLINDDDDIELQNQAEANRMHWCLGDVQQMFGNNTVQGYEVVEDAPKVFYPDADPSGSNPTISQPTYEDPSATQPVSDRAAGTPAQPVSTGTSGAVPWGSNSLKRDSSKPIGNYYQSSTTISTEADPISTQPQSLGGVPGSSQFQTNYRTGSQNFRPAGVGGN